MNNNTLSPALVRLSRRLEQAADNIIAERKAKLDQLADLLLSEKASVQIIVICTHNSRRSHLGQLLLQLASEYYGLDLDLYSGGTEGTAVYQEVINALERAGFRIHNTLGDDQMNYEVYFNAAAKPAARLFSKKYDDPVNPAQGFTAIMVCSEADQGCPVVVGAAKRFFLPFEDPKRFDGTPEEEKAYDDKLTEIGREMFYVARKLKEKPVD